MTDTTSTAALTLVDFVWQADGTVAPGQVRVHIPGEINSRVVTRDWGYPSCDGRERVNGCADRCAHADAARGFVGTRKRSHKR